MTTSSTNNSVFRGFFEKQKLTGPNFIDWYRQLRIVLSIEDKLNYLEQPIPSAPVAPAGQQVAPEILATHNAWIKGSKKIAGLMLMTMEPEIQRNLEPLHAHEILKEQEEGQSVSSYVLKIKVYIDNLERLGHPVTLGLGVSLILIGLRKEYNGFVQNYNMHNMGKTVNELHAMLKLHEQTLPKSNATALNAIRADKYLAELMKKKKNAASGAGGSGHLKNVSLVSEKIARKPYTHQVERAKDLLGLIHIDVCGPFKIMSRQGASYFVTFTDDFSRYGYVYLLKHKHEVFETFKVFQKEVENQLGKTIISLRSDREGEYMSQEFLDHLKDHGIIAHRTSPYTPQHNGVTLQDMVRSMISQTTLPKSFWDYQLETAARILNMAPTKKVEKTPYEETMGYSFYYPPENKVLVARNAEFLENSLIDQEASRSLEDLEIIQEDDTHPSLDTSLNQEEDDLEIDEPQSDIVPIRRSTRTRHAPDHMCLYIDAEEHELGDLGEAANYKAALLDPDKWLFKKKTDMDGNVHIYKARLVEKGYTQTIGIDYEETFSPVAEIRAIGILIAIAAYYDYEIWKIDVKTAFLNGYLNEEKKLKLSKSQGASTLAELKRMQNAPYASAVGSIMYAVRCTRPGVAFAQNVTSRFQQNPGDIYWTTVKNILKYLRNTKDMFLVYEGDLKRELRVSCYTDVGYLTDADDLKSQTGYVFVLNGGAVDWKSAKQSIFATSSAKTKYIAAFDDSKEAVWVRKFISGLGVVPIIKEPISMYCDNTGAIAIANESGITKVARHFRAKVHYLREVIEFGDIKLEKVHTDDNLADPFTKALAFPKPSEHTKNIGMLSASSLM
nr:hypothetical protein [Tanacetum cinerariifolium]